MTVVSGKSSGGGGLRDVIRDVLNEEGRREKVATLVDSAFELRRLGWAHCPGCRRKVQVEVPDVKATAGVLVELLEQAEGRPGTAGVEDVGVVLVVERRWPSEVPAAA